ncbi:MAG: cyclopropane fatty acyl phospholipid synthase [Acidimicrobiales bacterium]
MARRDVDARARAFVLNLIDAAGITLDGPGPGDIRIHDERFYPRVIRDRELGLGEAYQEGWWSADRVDVTLAAVLAADLKARVRVGPRMLLLLAQSSLANRQNIRRASGNASYHYDIGNDLFERMLDKRMIYSCAYWADALDLGEAQEAKLDLVCRKLYLEPGMRVLDIGCGWGGFAQFAAERYGVKVTGITPAAAQVEVARQRCAGLDVEILQTDFRRVRGEYDRVVSIGMLEHVGPKNFQAYFDATHRLLTRDGLALCHTIGSNSTRNHTDPWFDRYIFPGGVVPSLEHIGRASLEQWAVEDLHNFGPDYDRTLMTWLANVEQAWDELPGYDETFRRTWRYYLSASAASFRVRRLQLWQLVFSKAGVASPTYAAVR